MFHVLLTVFLVAVSGLAWSGGHTLELSILPWEGATLIRVVFFTGLAGLAVTLLAVRRTLPWLLVVWSAAVLAMLVHGYFFSQYKFPLDATLCVAGGLIAGAALALVGSVCVARTAKRTTRESVFA